MSCFQAKLQDIEKKSNFGQTVAAMCIVVIIAWGILAPCLIYLKPEGKVNQS